MATQIGSCLDSRSVMQHVAHAALSDANLFLIKALLPWQHRCSGKDSFFPLSSSVIFFPLSDKDISHGLFTQLQFHLGDRCKLTRPYVKRSRSQRCRSSRRRRGETKPEGGLEGGLQVIGKVVIIHVNQQSAPWSSPVSLVQILKTPEVSAQTLQASRLQLQFFCRISNSYYSEVLFLKDRGHCLGNSRELHLCSRQRKPNRARGV